MTRRQSWWSAACWTPCAAWAWRACCRGPKLPSAGDSGCCGFAAAQARRTCRTSRCAFHFLPQKTARAPG